MESLVLEKVNGGLLYLYSADGKKEFCSHLEAFLSEFFRNVAFSILTPAERPGSFQVEYTTGLDLPDFDKTPLSSEVLGKAFARGGDHLFQGFDCPDLVIAGHLFPVRQVKVMGFGQEALGIMVFHEELVLQGVGELVGVEECVFDHVFTAFYYMSKRDALAERLQWSEAKLEAIGEISGVLGQFELDALLSLLISVYIRLTEAQVGSVVLDGNLAADVEWGLPRCVLEQLRERGGKGLRARVVETGEPLLVRGYSDDPRFEPLHDFSIDSFLCVPLVSNDRVLGTVNLVNGGASKGGMFTEMDKATVATISSLAASAIENAILHNDLLEKERIKANLQLARSIQQGMYPVKGLVIPGYEMAWVTRSCDETGGDYFDFFTLEDGRAAFAIGDVSGHGIGAALLMASGRANLRALLSVKTDLKEVMERLNDLLSRDMDEEKFMTLFLASLDYKENRLAFVNAGHDQPLIFRSQDSSVEELETTGLPVGMMPGWSYELRSTPAINPGDVLLLTTDGVWEPENPEGERFGRERLKRVLRDSAERSAHELVDAILQRVKSYTQGHPHPDDLTILVMKRVQ